MHGLSDSPALVEALGQSDVFLAFQEALSRAATTDRPVLLVGERGTGKELAAARLHYLSPRWQGPLVILDGAALTPSLAEDELFGHDAGAFTGATSRRIGRFERAAGGTLFLDEAGNLPLAVQDKLLRVIEYGQFERVGGDRVLHADARIVAATNADLRAHVSEGRFRADLLDRLAFMVLHVPPLRARGEDIMLLAEHFAATFAAEMALPAPRFTARARALLMAHPWPGNVRELKNAVERTVLRFGGAGIDTVDLDPFASPWQPGSAVLPVAAAASTPDVAGGSATSGNVGTPAEARSLPLAEAVRQLELQALQHALHAARHNRRVAATMLGLSYDQFRGLYRRHRQDIEPEQQ